MKINAASSPVPRATSWPLPVLLILLLALVARLWALGRAGLWQDEMGFMVLVRPDLTLGQLMQAARDYILSVGQMPFAFLLQHVYVNVLGAWIPEVERSAFWMRLPAVIWGVVAVAGVYRLVGAAADEKRARAAALLFALMFFPVYYSREVYCYAAILAASAWMTACALRHLSPPAHPWKSALASALWALVLVFSHLNGALYFACLAAVVGVFWLLSLVKRRGAAPFSNRKLAALLALWTGVLLLVMPYLLRFLFENKAHTGGHASSSLWLILQDPVAKMFLGERLPLLVLSWALFAFGVRRAFRQGPAALLLAATGLAAWLAIGLMTARSQYLSVRYFSPLAPVFCWFLVEGLAGISDWLGARVKRPDGPWLPGLAALVVAGHVGFFLLPMYGLRDKDLGFARIAEWLNAHLPPGTPFLMESAYELRWVSGYHPTPGLIGAAPYVHGGGPGEMERLHQKQRAFMERFPEAPFVQSAHHNVDGPGGIWTFPHTFHGNHDRLANEPLRNLVRRGIFIGMPFEHIADHSYATEIYYSGPADMDRWTLGQGRAARAEFPGWAVGQVAQGEYRRMLPAGQGSLRVVRVVPEPVRVSLDLRAALDADPGRTYSVVLSQQGRELYRASQLAGQWWTLHVPVLELAQPATELELRCEGLPAPRGLVLDDLALTVVPP